jgi:uncharacterized phage-associated protein
MNKNIKLLKLLYFIFKVLFYAIKEREDKKKRYIEKKVAWLSGPINRFKSYN